MAQSHLNEGSLGEVRPRSLPGPDHDHLVDIIEPALRPIGGRSDSDDLDTHASRGPEDTRRDFAPVGDENTSEHGPWYPTERV